MTTQNTLAQVGVPTLIDYAHHGSPPRQGHLRDARLAALLHRGGHVARAQRQLWAMVRELIGDAAAAGEVRDDIGPDELATYCLQALAAASCLPSRAAVRRLVSVVLEGLRCRPGTESVRRGRP